MHFVARNTAGEAPGLRPPSHLLSPNVYGHRYRSNSNDSKHSWIKFKLAGSGSQIIPTSDNEGTDDEVDFDENQDLTQEFVKSKELTKDHDCLKEGCNRVVLNVSGMRFETQMRTLNRLPHTLLGDKEKRDKFWDPRTHEYFFDRHRPSFPAILYFYQSGGRLEKPIEVPSDIFLNELQFFELGKNVINSYKKKEGFIVEAEETFDMPKGVFQRRMWELFEYPESSLPARILAGFSVLLIVASVTTFCVETLPVFDGTQCVNTTHFSDNGTVQMMPNFGHPLFIIESICIAWFVMELICRFIFCPSKLAFLKNIINWIDLASIAPYFLFMIVFFVTWKCDQSNQGGILSVLRVFRVVRIFKLSKHSEGLKILGKTLQTSMRELSMFALFIAIGIVIFGGAIYYAELQEPQSFFTSIPDAFWWAVVSMTTVGYGDVYPRGVIGKLVGSLTVLCGLLAIALPVPVIVTNFNNFYRNSIHKHKS
ncbi:potassium voltage-gated channel subfamily A member 1-like [Ostrea edulis]|uniref:potassium voltage-gated channel subfamily A member 1-like n=1 Tax=Ostrea edulis TaxID=37623 RepID=UPI0024AED011|nr:potassium voltage-gated channel subfamily A member 1-like [Ostrea edulis]